MIPTDDLIERNLPRELVAHIPPQDRWWRGRTILVLWAIGHPLREAWAFGMDDTPDQAAFYRDMMGRLDDARLSADLEASAAGRARRSVWP